MRRMLLLLTVVFLVAGLMAGCSTKKKDVLRIAMGSPGETMIKVFEEIQEMYEKKYPNVKIEYNFQDDDLYETIGLPNLLNSENAPDIYFEWEGERIRMRYNEGYAADLTAALQEEGFKGRFDEDLYKGMTIDGKIYMVPSTIDVSNVIWYNKKIFSDLSLQPPTTWEAFLDVNEKIKNAGIIPIASGNKDLWAAGNWIGHLISRVIGEQAYSDALMLKRDFNAPDFVKALEYAKQLADLNYVNDSVNAISDNEGAVLFFNGKAAMHPIGSWLVSWAIEEAPDLDFDFFNLPEISGAAGDQTSMLGVVTGHMINKNTKMFREAVDFLKLYSSPEVSALILEGGSTPATVGSLDPNIAPETLVNLMDMLTNAGAVVAPPDTGYNLEVAEALYMAVAEVIGGQSEPAKALENLDNRIAHLK